MQELSIKIDKATSTPDADLVLEIARSAAREKDIFPIIQKVSTCQAKDVEYKAGRSFDALGDEQKTILLEEIKTLKNRLTSMSISYNQLSGRTKSQGFNIVLLILGFVPFLIGRVLNIKYSANQKKVKKMEFKAVMKLCSFLMMYPVYLIALGLLIGFVNWKFIIAIFLLPVFGWFSYVYEGQWKELKANRMFASLDKEEYNSLSKTYNHILSNLNLNQS